MQFSVPLKADFHINFNRQVSQQSSGESMQLRCPVYVYNCSLEHLKEQLVHPTSSRQPSDIFFRYVSHLHCTPSDEGRFRLMTIERTDAGRGLHGFQIRPTSQTFRFFICAHAREASMVVFNRLAWNNSFDPNKSVSTRVPLLYLHDTTSTQQFFTPAAWS